VGGSEGGDQNSGATYPLHMGFSCTYRAKELNFFVHVLSIILHLCIKFQVQINVVVKKILTDLNL
jgi:hypothetical protein